jgi:hypothetical protein
MRKAIFVILLSFALLALGAGEAFATSCSPVNKPAGAGSAGTATVNVVTGEFTPVDLNVNPAGKLRGGFISVTAVLPDGTVVGGGDVFTRDLPDGAHNAGPGGSECDGVGIDDLAECGG